jgi:dienelactone hydrolase
MMLNNTSRNKVPLFHLRLFLAFTISLVIICSGTGTAWAASKTKALWDLEALNKPPKMNWIVDTGPVRALEYHGLPYKGKITSVFAYYATPGIVSGKPALDKDLPGVILIHGGKGHAEKSWVTTWAKFGYAALAMDLSGCGLDNKPLPNSVPSDNLLDYDWNYHAVANTVLAHSLLLSFKEVHTGKTAVTGISLGGQIIDIVMNLDKRFKAAVPVYGCGYLHESGLFFEGLQKMDREQRDEWVRSFDPSSYLQSVRTPMLFVTGTNDAFYPLDRFAKTCRLPKGDRNFFIAPEMPHSMDVGTNLPEVAIFIDQYCRNGVPLPSIERPRLVKGAVQARVTSRTRPIMASTYYTTDTCNFKDRKWLFIDAQIKGAEIKWPAPPRNATAWLLTLSDDRKATVSSEVVFP